MKYNIKTIDDIFNCVTTENIDNFLKDFESLLRVMTSTKEIGKAIDEDFKFDSQEFIWIDDGEHNINITIQSNEKENEPTQCTSKKCCGGDCHKSDQ